MPLSQTVLSNAIKSALDQRPDTLAEGVQNFADAYTNWAQGGLFGASTIGTVAALNSAIVSQLLSAPSTLSGFGTAVSQGLTIGWVGVPVAGAQAGATVACPGAAALASSIPAALAIYPDTSQDSADILAGLLYTATLTVTAAVSPPPGTILPIV